MIMMLKSSEMCCTMTSEHVSTTWNNLSLTFHEARGCDRWSCHTWAPSPSPPPARHLGIKKMKKLKKCSAPRNKKEQSEEIKKILLTSTNLRCRELAFAFRAQRALATFAVRRGLSMRAGGGDDGVNVLGGSENAENILRSHRVCCEKFYLRCFALICIACIDLK